MKALICYNPCSGKQKVGKNLDYIKERLKEKYEQIDVYETTGEKSLTYHLKEHANDYDLVMVSGGDGTLNEAVTGLIEGNSKTKLAYIPGGTCNDVGSMLGLPKSIKKAINIIMKHDAVLMDVGTANEKYFTYVFGVGKFIDISYITPSKMKRKYGKLAYFIYGVKEFATNKKVRMKLETRDKIYEGDYYVVLGLNSNQVAGFKLYRKRSIKLNDGKFDLTLIEKKGLMSWPRLFRFMLFGDRALKYGITTITVDSAKITFDEEIPCNIDGEYAFKSKVCDIGIIKNAINIVVPDKVKKKYF